MHDQVFALVVDHHDGEGNQQIDKDPYRSLDSLPAGGRGRASIAIRHAPSLADGGRGTATATNADTGRMPGRRKLTR